MPADASLPNFPLDFPRDRTCPFDPPSALSSCDPLTEVVTWSGTTAWLVTNSDDYRAICRDAERFSTRTDAANFPAPTPGMAAVQGRFMSQMDPPDHTRLRRLVAGEFSVRAVEGLRPRIRSVVEGLLDDLADAGPPADLVDSFAAKVPNTVICEVLGLAADDRPRIHELVVRMFDLEAAPNSAETAAAALRTYVSEAVAGGATAPGLIGSMHRGEVATGAMTESELCDMVIMLVGAGFESTASTIASGILLLLADDRSLRALRDDPSLWANTVEEVLRYTAVAHLGRRRTATTEVELSSGTIKRGDGVIALENVANRDPRAFEDPDRFDIHRPARSHLTFGFGIHACLGGPLARVELQESLRGLFERFSDIRLESAPTTTEFSELSQVYGPRHVSVAW